MKLKVLPLLPSAAIGAVVSATLILLPGGCATRVAPANGSFLTVPRLARELQVDGRLDEACYQKGPLTSNFRVAGEPEKLPPPTQAWLFWEPQRLTFAFDVTDPSIVAAGETGREHDVDAQDRVELFLWSGQTNATYYCLEVGARGAAHHYAARFYRRFDDAWAPAAWKVAVASKPGGYVVEGELPRAALDAIGFKLRPGNSWRCGLFRADFQPGKTGDPTWICWVDARGPQPDFHVTNSFGGIVLGGR